MRLQKLLTLGFLLFLFLFLPTLAHAQAESYVRNVTTTADTVAVGYAAGGTAVLLINKGATDVLWGFSSGSAVIHLPASAGVSITVGKRQQIWAKSASSTDSLNVAKSIVP